jgi:geranylgeranyl pyrophosphate synthase
MIHTHSLILDDMPCMDDDDRRRGRPAAHLAFGEAVALLAADALLNLAIAILADNHRTAGVPPETALAVIREVGEAVGTAGMIGGQAGDLEFAGGGPIATLERIHLGKTARLFRLSARAAALVAGAGAEDVEAAGAYGDSLGLAFQIVDDVLDARGSDGRRGARPEPSYAGAYGASVARDLARQATERALAALAPFGTHADILRALAQTNLERQE